MLSDTARASYAPRGQEDVFVLSVELALPFGLVGEYWNNVFFRGSSSVVRVDAVVNFTWGVGCITRGATDLVSARWKGAIRANVSGIHSFRVLADDNVRLWIDGKLLIDSWDTPSGNANSANIDLLADSFAAITLEYRDLVGEAHLQLFWTPPGGREHIVPSYALYQLRHIKGSPLRAYRGARRKNKRCVDHGVWWRSLNRARGHQGKVHHPAEG